MIKVQKIFTILLAISIVITSILEIGWLLSATFIGNIYILHKKILKISKEKKDGSKKDDRTVYY